MKPFYVILHAGAGRYNKNHIEKYRSLLTKTLKTTLESLHAGKSLTECVQIALHHFEDSSLANAGFGSALTIKGTIEMESCIVDGESGVFGGVAALKNIVYPSRVAYYLLQDQFEEKELQSPAILCGDGAYDYAISRGLHHVDDIQLVSADALNEFQLYTRRFLGKHGETKHTVHGKDRKKRKLNPEMDDCETEKDQVYDTVGVIITNSEGFMACGASSGGTPLRPSGRIGPVSCYGSGIYCREYTNSGDTTNFIGSCTSGTGEHIMQTLLAQNICTSFNESDDQNTILNNIKNCFTSTKVGNRQAGFIATKARINHDNEEPMLEALNYFIGLSTPSLIYAYQNSNEATPNFFVEENNTPSEWISVTAKIL